MLIPNMPPINLEVLQPVKDGSGNTRYFMHPSWHNFFTQWNIEMQNNASNEGIVMPSQTATNIALLDPTNPNKFGATLYDRTNNLAKININGVFKTITTS